MDLYIVTGTSQGLGAALAERIALDPANELIALSRAPDAPIPGGARLQVVQRDVEDVEVAQAPRGQRPHGAIEDHRDRLLVHAAMGAKRRIELRMVVAQGAGPQP